MAEEVTLNQLGTMIEGLRGDVKAVAEGHGVIRSEMKQMKTELLEKIEENNSAIKWVAKDLGGKIEGVREKVDKLDERTGRIEDKLDAHMRQPAHV